MSTVSQIRSSDCTVVCVLRTGARVVDRQPYTVEHVTKLRRGVAQHLAAPHRFLCLTDQVEAVSSSGVEAAPLAENWPGWWSKINLFAPDQLTGPTLYLDLDSLIVGPLDGMFRAREGITMVRDFTQPQCMNSSAMAWMGDLSGLFCAFAADSANMRAHYDRARGARVGDQGFIHTTLSQMGQPIDVFDPQRVVSFKLAARQGPPPGVSVLSFHGAPKLDSPDSGWAFKYWSAL